MSSITINDVIQILIGEKINFTGNADIKLNSVNNISNATKHQITFCKYEDDRALKLIDQCDASLIIASTKIFNQLSDDQRKKVLFVEKPRFSFVQICNKFFAPKIDFKIEKTAIIGNNCKIPDDVYIGSNVSIGENVEIGSGTIIYSGVNIYNNVKIGKFCIINSGTVIGADGFGYERDENGEITKFPHYGGVEIKDNVEIGANTCIDRGTLGNTIIESSVKIDNLCHIAHNVKIGKNTFIIAHSQIGGSTMIGENCWIAPGVSVLNGIKIGNNVTVGMETLILKNLEDGTVLGAKGFPGKKK